MIAEDYIFIEAKAKPLSSAHLLKNTWLVILHAQRVPPHIGILIDGNYNSLTIKGQELEVSTEALLKTIHQRKIKTLFIELIKHPVFSGEYQLRVFQEQVKQFGMVKQNEATCLNPVKLFLEEFYALSYQANELLFELAQRLVANAYIKSVAALNTELTANGFELPIYTKETLQLRILQERAAFYTD